MSSYIRNMQKRILKRAGYKKDNKGNVLNPGGDVVDKTYPFTIPNIKKVG